MVFKVCNMVFKNHIANLGCQKLSKAVKSCQKPRASRATRFQASSFKHSLQSLLFTPSACQARTAACAVMRRSGGCLSRKPRLTSSQGDADPARPPACDQPWLCSKVLAGPESICFALLLKVLRVRGSTSA